jgi:polygalacturonase
MRKLFILAALTLLSMPVFAQTAAKVETKAPVYKASRFNIKSDGIHDNTTSIQGAIDFIASKGGGTLEFSVGRYITGSVQLKSGVDIQLREGAVIVGSSNIYSYKGCKGIFCGEGVENVTIYGKGVIDGCGPALLENIAEQVRLNHIPSGTAAPTLVYLKDCKNVQLKDFILRYPATKDNLYIIEGGSVTVDGCYSDTK